MERAGARRGGLGVEERPRGHVTLYITPVIYTYLDALQRRVRGFAVRRAERPLPVPSD